MVLCALVFLSVSSTQITPCLADDGVIIYRPENRGRETVSAQDAADSLHDVVPQVVPLPQPGVDSESLRITAGDEPGWPVVVAGDTLFFTYKSLGPYTAAERAKKIAERIDDIISNPHYRDYGVTLREEIAGTEIICDDVTITIVTHDEARVIGGLRQEIAAKRAKSIQQIIDRERARRNPRAVVLGLLSVAIATIALIIVWQIVAGLSRRLKDKLAGRHVLTFGPRSHDTHSPADERRADRLIAGIKTVRVLIQLGLVYAYATFVTGFFSATQGIHVSLNRQVSGLLDWAETAFVGLLPELFILATIATVAYICLQIVRLLFVGLSHGTLRWPGFRPEWALPSYRLVSVIMLFAALVVAWPHLPGSGSPAFVGVAIFLGALIAVGSVAAVANVVAGMIIGFTVPFRVGDRVSIGGKSGDVISWTLLMTRLRTDKNVEVIIPNSLVLSGSIVNYSHPSPGHHLIVPAHIAVGYDVPPSRVHELLINAARRTRHVLDNPAPFVRQKQMNAASVVYELNVHTGQPKLMPEITSTLNVNIRDVFAEAGIEIHGTDEPADSPSESDKSDAAVTRNHGFNPFQILASTKLSSDPEPPLARHEDEATK